MPTLMNSGNGPAFLQFEYQLLALCTRLERKEKMIDKLNYFCVYLCKMQYFYSIFRVMNYNFFQYIIV